MSLPRIFHSNNRSSIRINDVLQRQRTRRRVRNLISNNQINNQNNNQNNHQNNIQNNHQNNNQNNHYQNILCFQYQQYEQQLFNGSSFY